MERFTYSDINIQRLILGSYRRLREVPDDIIWTFGNRSVKDNNKRLATYKNKHKKERCFLIANGPSLNSIDLSLLRNEITIGLNRIYLLFEQMQFSTTYFVAINELVLEQFSKDIQQIPVPKFLNWNRRNIYNNNNSSVAFLKIKNVINDRFCDDITRKLSSGGTVTYVALQIAFYMGFEEVIIVGLDHNFSDKGTPNKTEVRSSYEDKNHFHPNYFPKGVKWQLPDLNRSEIAYRLANEHFKKNGRRILDGTVDGKCQIFSKVDYYSLF